MSREMLISDRPKWSCKIMNFEKDWEVRRKVDPNFRGWVNVYSTKHKDIARIISPYEVKDKYVLENEITEENFKYVDSGYSAKGKVVARYYCDDIYVFDIQDPRTWEDSEFAELIMKHVGMTLEELHAYTGDKKFYAMHITKLEVFDTPKNLCDFWNTKKGVFCQPITRAPQSYCFVLGEE